MNSLLSVLNCLLAALLYFHSAKMAHIPNEGLRKNEVIKFLEVWRKSYCRPIETLIDILHEYPEEVEYIFKPSCVPLMRCGGCCNDESLECAPIELHNVTMEIMKIKPHHEEHIRLMHFVQHSKCICRSKREGVDKQKSQRKRGKGKGQNRRKKKCSVTVCRPNCEPCSEKRKHLFVQDPQSCKCSCKFTHLRCKSRGLELNERSCRCERPRR